MSYRTDDSIVAAVGSVSDSNIFTDTLKSKLDNVAASANNYVHPNHSGDVTSVADGEQTIALNAVTNAKSAKMATNTIKGNNTGGDSDPLDLTVAQVISLLSVYTQTEIDALVDATLKPHEAYDPAASGNFPATYGGEAIEAGDSFKITSADTLGTGTVVDVNDTLYALVDTPGQTDANWLVAQSNVDQATTTVLGLVKLASIADIDTGTDEVKTITPAGLAGSALATSVSSNTTDVTMLKKGGKFAITPKAANYSAAYGDGIIQVTAEATITLPAIDADHHGEPIIVKSQTASTVTIDTTGADTIDLAESTTITTQYDSLTFVPDNTNKDWVTI